MNNQLLEQKKVDEIWQSACNRLQTELSPAVYSTWIASNPLTQIEIIETNRAKGVFSCPTAFHAANLKKNLYSQIKVALESEYNKQFELHFIVGEPNHTSLNSKQSLAATNGFGTNKINSKNQPPTSPSISPTVEELFSAHTIQASFKDRAIAASRRVGLRTDYTFKTFAVSTSNEMAHAAASAVSNNPGTAYNPLFLYGGVGVGKTHLMQAIGNNILQRNPETSVLYCTGEEFTNEIVSAIQTKKALGFKHKYRNTQVLLIDDVQFIAGKNAVQEEFFHTFNSLTKNNSQIILTSDRPPHEINLLEDRLRSRFEAGLMIDIQEPSFELRTAILLIKAASNNLSIPMDIAQAIAAKVDSARKIEGVIKVLRSEVELKNREISFELIEEILKTETRSSVQSLRVQPQQVIKTVANHYRVKQSEIKGKSRTKNLVVARHVAMYILRNDLRMSLEEIGKWFSNRDHTSVLHASQKIEALINEKYEIKQAVSALKTSLLAISR